MLLIERAGQAAVYATNSPVAEEVYRLPGDSYRTVIGPSTLTQDVRETRRRKAVVRRLNERLREQFKAEDLDGVEQTHQELIDLGCEEAALVAEVQLARAQGDHQAELSARHRLRGLSPRHPPQSSNRYADLLERHWLIDEARRVCANMPPEKRDSQQTSWLERASKILASDRGDWVAVPEVPLPEIVKAATTVKRRFTGYWHLDGDGTMSLPEGHVTAEQLVAAYERVKAKSGLTDYPLAETRSVWWLDKRTANRVELILFDDPFPQGGGHMVPAIRLEMAGMPNGFTPVLLFSAPPSSIQPTAEAHNRQVLQAYQRVVQQELSVGWPEKLRRVVSRAVQLLRTPAHATPTI